MGARVLRHMVRTGWFNEGGGVAFFRKNKVAVQFGVKERMYKFDWRGVLGPEYIVSSTTPGSTSYSVKEWRDASPHADRKNRPHWPRGTVYMIGSTQMVVVLDTSKHQQGKNEFEAIVGTIAEEEGMQQVFDRIYAYNDIIDHPSGGPGPDQTDIYQRGWAYLNQSFPLVDAIVGCSYH